ncbi:MAG TPA: YeeE/YedE family protein [Dokdonella sp.]|jgi:uncharacterized membrane protein YedE/YeeE|uniref:DUF6691 family protein n=1 Tax=Dokdonella sp. TaxID=2291710 RepID=UPI0025C63C28|nr:DUF6691 family protein [Dokdonella sp.]HNV09605.1 YeeE/YedE family protein [Dokdonella sp.]HPW03225.1 YeeE/YedE family protein [Dokdonella sp.]
MSRLLVSALVAGALFGLGLAMSGMTDARIVLGFLDVAGAFDPTLMFVLAGAVATTALLFTPILRGGHPLFASAFQVSNLKHIDAPLLAGAALFGIGWGIAGYCPGPALAGLGAGSLESLWFVPAMLAGSLLHRLLFR